MSDPLDNVTPIPTGGTNTEEEQLGPQGQPKNTEEPAPSVKERQEAKARAEAEAKAKTQETEQGTTEETTEEDDEDKPLDTSKWGDYGDDEVTTSTLAVLQNSGVTPEEAKALLWDAVQSGDISKIDRDALVEKVGKAKATLILTGVRQNIENTQKQIDAVKKVTAEVAGGEANWKVAAAWAVKNIPADDLEELRGMLDKGGRSAKVAAQEIVEKYNTHPGNTSLNKSKTITPSGKGGEKLEPLTRQQYGQELLRANRRGASATELGVLLERRKLGKKQGI